MSQHYVDLLVDSVIRKMNDTLFAADRELVVRNAANASLQAPDFITFYNRTVLDSDGYDEPDFFQTFVRLWGIQGIPNGAPFMERLARDRRRIQDLVVLDHPIYLYREYLEKAIHVEADPETGTEERSREEGVFFAKLVHCLSHARHPCLSQKAKRKYAPFDRPMKVFFGLGESFPAILALDVITRAYREWADENPETIAEIRAIVTNEDAAGLLRGDELPPFRLLDMIFWHVANRS